MLFSMTGFGKGEAALADGSAIHIEISSVNRKQLELRFSMPPELTIWENSARKLISSMISRGAVQLRVTVVSGRSAPAAAVDHTLLDALIRECQAARVRNGADGSVAVEQLLLLPGVLRTHVLDPESSAVTAALEKALLQAGENYRAMRIAEGETLRTDLETRLARLEALHAKLADLTAGQPEAAKQRLLARFSQEKFPVAADDSALLKEVLFYVDRGDVTEELTRLNSHFAQFRNFLNSDQPVGRSLDFLAQEIFREITTLGNKAFASGVSPFVVEFKAEMEKIREQIQNIE